MNAPQPARKPGRPFAPDGPSLPYTIFLKPHQLAALKPYGATVGKQINQVLREFFAPKGE